MKKIFLVLTLILTTLASIAQQKVNFTLQKKMKIEGVVFDDNYLPGFRIAESFGRFTPTLSDIKTAESYLLLNVPVVKYINLTGFYSPETLKNRFNTYKRQYIGYLTAKRDSIILIQLLNFKQKKKAEISFKGWKQKVIVGFDGFYESNLKIFKINISNKSVSIY